MKRIAPLIAVAAALGVVVAIAVAISVDGGETDPPTAGTDPPTTTTGQPPPAGTSAPEITETEFNRSQLPADLETVSQNWTTDFSRTTIGYDELLIGIRAMPIRDRIPPIDNPDFDPAAGAEHVAGREPGLSLDVDGDARFYPLSILTSHEIVNDVVAGRPVAVTYCPLCNSAIVFDRVFEGRELRFGVSGLLRNSDLVMWDNVTESLWQQLTGEGLIGEFAGSQLTFLPSAITSFEDFKRKHPEGQVLGPDQGFGRSYGYNPYTGYSSRTTPFGFFDQNDLDDRFPALERVVNVTVGETAKAYPFSIIKEAGVGNDTVAGVDVVVFWGGDTADALDATEIAQAAGIGTGIAFNRTVDGQSLTFSANGDDTFADAETSSTWDLNGTALTGPLTGTRLAPVVHGNEFWFAWAVFNPDADVYGN
ncbi:MAG: DUF3179 domain-containing protein [Acidimicrobiia bacterium]|nr:DUF3179 domain-containing protein [Acidimicrobiia bacterium]